MVLMRTCISVGGSLVSRSIVIFFFYLSSVHLELFFFNDTATTEIYTLSLHDALPISVLVWLRRPVVLQCVPQPTQLRHRFCISTLNILYKIGRAHVWTPVTPISRMPSSAWKKKQLESPLLLSNHPMTLVPSSPWIQTSTRRHHDSEYTQTRNY